MVEPEFDSGLRQLPPSRIAMEERLESAARHFFPKNARRVLVGIAGVDHKRKAGFAGGGNVSAKPGLLILAAAFLVKIVQPHFADCDDPGMARVLDDFLGTDVQLFGRVVRVRADGARHLGEAFRDGKHLAEFPHARANGQHMPHARALRARHKSVEVALEVREIQMAMTVD